MSQTYDPILEVQALPRFRISPGLRGPAMGTALVLERALGIPVVVWPGERVPDARTGNYRRMYVVDVANRGLTFTVSAPSADPAFPFTVTVRFACRIADPVTVVQDGIRDMTAALAPSLTAIVRDVAARFDAMHPGGAEAEIVNRLGSARPSPIVALTGFTASVSMVDEEEIVTARRKIRVEEMKRAAMRPVASGTREEMLAHIMALADGNPMPMLDREAADREAHTRAQLDALRIITGDGDKLEEFSASDIRKQTLTEFFGESAAIPSRRGSVRKHLESKSGKPHDAGSVVEGNVPDGPSGDAPSGDKASPPPESNGRGPSRVRGTMGRHADEDR